MVRKTNSLSKLAILGSIVTVCIGLSACNYPGMAAATATPQATVRSTDTPTANDGTLIGETPRPTETPAASDTPLPSDTPAASDTPAMSDTPQATITPTSEQVGVVILNGQQIGLIQKSGDKFNYLPDPYKLTPEVEGKVVLQIKDPALTWGFNLESSSSTMYNLKDDPRSGWEAYGVLLAYEGNYEITVKFIALNAQTGEKLNGKVRIKIVGATILATDTPEPEEPAP
jgi:hypothetical protein